MGGGQNEGGGGGGGDIIKAVEGRHDIRPFLWIQLQKDVSRRNEYGQELLYWNELL
jgi:hypothetical protein